MIALEDNYNNDINDYEIKDYSQDYYYEIWFSDDSNKTNELIYTEDILKKIKNIWIFKFFN